MKEMSIQTGENTRRASYDCLRATAVLAILMVHAMPVEVNGSCQWWFNSIMTPVLLSFVGIYFMLSGLFLLERGTEDMGQFYKKRFIAVGVPFLVYDFVHYCYNLYVDVYLNEGFRGILNTGIFGHLFRFLYQVFTAQVARGGHLWFMYALAAFYICAPFLSRMLKNMTDRELKIFLVIMMVLPGLEVAGEIAGVNITPWTQYVLYTGWAYYFVLGYGLKRLCSRSQYPLILILAFLGLAFDVAQKRLFPWWVPQNPHKSPAMVFICAAIFLLFEFYGEKIPAFAGKIGVFVSRYSYSIYLIHFLILSYYVTPVLVKDLLARHYILGTLVSTAVTFVLSLAASLVLDNLAVKPLQKGFSKLLKQKS
ncbi:MAG: acyltransferase [Enterocloster sp.]